MLFFIAYFIIHQEVNNKISAIPAVIIAETILDKKLLFFHHSTLWNLIDKNKNYEATGQSL